MSARLPGLLLLCAFCAVFPAAAEENASYEPRGLRVGRLLVLPALEAEQAWTSNVYLEESGETSDFATRVRPSVQLDAEIARHHATITAGGEFTRFRQEDSENTENMHLDMRADLEALRALRLQIDAGLAVDHEERKASLSTTLPETPVEYATRRVAARMVYAPARLKLGVYGEYEDKRFEDARVRATGADDIQRDRDRARFTAGVRTEYEAGSLAPFADVSRSWVNYRRREYIGGNAFSGADQDRIEDRFRLGVRFDTAERWTGRISAGYGLNRPEEPGYDTQFAWIADADVTWHAGALTDVIFGINRAFEDDNDLSQGVLTTRTSINVQHEIARDWLLDLGLERVWRDFAASPRQDVTTGMGISLSYAMNRYLSLVTDLTRNVRDADGGGAGYDETVAAVRMRGQI